MPDEKKTVQGSAGSKTEKQKPVNGLKERENKELKALRKENKELKQQLDTLQKHVNQPQGNTVKHGDKKYAIAFVDHAKGFFEDTYKKQFCEQDDLVALLVEV